MQVTEKPKLNALVEHVKWGAYNGTGNYVKSKEKFSLTVAQLEKSAFPNASEKLNELSLFEEENEKPIYVVYEKEKEKKSDLPLASELLSDYDASPASLKFANFRGLQFYTKR